MAQLAARLCVYENRSLFESVIEKMELLYMYSRLRVCGEAFDASDKASENPFPELDQEEGEDPEDYADRIQEWCDEMFDASLMSRFPMTSVWNRVSGISLCLAMFGRSMLKPQGLPSSANR